MEIQEILDQNFRGNIYILQKDKVLYEREWGFADLPNEIPNTIETKFASASAGKVFIAVGILQFCINRKYVCAVIIRIRAINIAIGTFGRQLIQFIISC